MSDALEMVLKDAIKKIVAEAMLEVAQGGLSAAAAPAIRSTVSAAAAAAPSIPVPAMPAPCLGWERFIFAMKSLCFGGLALGMCGFASSCLFPTDDAVAANDAAWLQQVHREAMENRGNWGGYGHHRYHYDPNLLDINDPNDPDVAACMAEEEGKVPQKLTWADLADPAKLKAMYKTNAFLHAQPEDLTAIVIFYELEKMATGQPIHLQDIPGDFKNSLPCGWRPAFDAVTAHTPGPPQLLPMPADFIGPFAPYYN